MIFGVALMLTTLACGGADRILPPTITLVRPPTDMPRSTDTPLPTHTVRPRPDPVQTIHVVQPGETLSQIAKQYGVSVDALTAANGIADPHLIKIGQELIIPGPASATR
jgi:LysM repeat protein